MDPKFRTTGAIYNVPEQNLDESVVARGPGQWNEFEILVKDNRLTVFLNGQQKTDFVNNDPNRGQPTTPGFIGLQTHTGHGLCRNIQFEQHPESPCERTALARAVPLKRNSSATRRS